MAHRSKAFTLVEMLVVISIIAVLLAITGLLSFGRQNSQKLQAESIEFSNTLNRTLLEASSRNRTSLLRLYRHVDPRTPGSIVAWRSWQVLGRDENHKLQPLGEIHQMQTGVIIHSDAKFSTLFATDALTRGVEMPKAAANDTQLPEGIAYNYTYVEMEIRPNGSNSLRWSSGNRTWCVTFVLENTGPAPGESLPANNYRTVLIDPFNTRTTSY